MKWNQIRLDTSMNYDYCSNLPQPDEHDTIKQQETELTTKDCMSNTTYRDEAKQKPITKPGKNNSKRMPAMLKSMEDMDPYTVQMSVLEGNHKYQGQNSKMHMQVTKVVNDKEGSIRYLVAGWSKSEKSFSRQSVIQDDKLFKSAMQYYLSKASMMKKIIL